jgi:hypothetical protein
VGGIVTETGSPSSIIPAFSHLRIRRITDQPLVVAVPEGGASARGDRRQPHGSLLTRRWREMDSNFRSLYAKGRRTRCLHEVH